MKKSDKILLIVADCMFLFVILMSLVMIVANNMKAAEYQKPELGYFTTAGEFVPWEPSWWAEEKMIPCGEWVPPDVAAMESWDQKRWTEEMGRDGYYAMRQYPEWKKFRTVTIYCYEGNPEQVIGWREYLVKHGHGPEEGGER